MFVTPLTLRNPERRLAILALDMAILASVGVLTREDSHSNELLAHGALRKSTAGGHSTSYELNEPPAA